MMELPPPALVSAGTANEPRRTGPGGPEFTGTIIMAENMTRKLVVLDIVDQLTG
jgi:hypothetical protein